jgi:hypothetical protein
MGAIKKEKTQKYVVLDEEGFYLIHACPAKAKKNTERGPTEFHLPKMDWMLLDRELSQIKSN